MDSVGIALIVGGMAFFGQWPNFLIPTERELSSSQVAFEESQERIKNYLAQMRNERGEH